MIPKKDLREFQSDDESDIDPYEDEDTSSEEREDGEIPDKLITEGEKVESEDDNHVTRFDSLEDSSNYTLDKSKEYYAKKYCKLHLIEDKIQKAILDSAPMPANSFLTPSEVDDYLPDIIGDQRSLKFLKMNDSALNFVQKRVNVWDLSRR